jgi:hypothetical protein
MLSRSQQINTIWQRYKNSESVTCFIPCNPGTPREQHSIFRPHPVISHSYSGPVGASTPRLSSWSHHWDTKEQTRTNKNKENGLKPHRQNRKNCQSPAWTMRCGWFYYQSLPQYVVSTGCLHWLLAYHPPLLLKHHPWRQSIYRMASWRLDLHLRNASPRAHESRHKIEQASLGHVAAICSILSDAQ